jgi:glycogen operon protein
MLLGGDEIGRTQHGNNNAYCQDNAVSWFDWANADTDLLEWTRHLIRLRRAHPVFCRRRFFQGRPVRGLGRDGLVDIGWFRPDGEQMTDADWSSGYAKSIGVFLNGHAIPDRDRRGQQILDSSFYLLLNAWEEPLDFTLPAARWGASWEVVLDTGRDLPPTPGTVYLTGETVNLQGRNLVLLQRE